MSRFLTHYRTLKICCNEIIYQSYGHCNYLWLEQKDYRIIPSFESKSTQRKKSAVTPLNMFLFDYEQQMPHPSFIYIVKEEVWWLQTLRAAPYYVKVEKHTSIWSIVTAVLHQLLVLRFIYCRCNNLRTKPDNCTHIMLHENMMSQTIK
jgi:hypothetical protein